MSLESGARNEGDLQERAERKSRIRRIYGNCQDPDAFFSESFRMVQSDARPALRIWKNL